MSPLVLLFLSFFFFRYDITLNDLLRDLYKMNNHDLLIQNNFTQKIENCICIQTEIKKLGSDIDWLAGRTAWAGERGTVLRNNRHKKGTFSCLELARNEGMKCLHRGCVTAARNRWDAQNILPRGQGAQPLNFFDF